MADRAQSKIKIHEAEHEKERDKWQCATCSSPAEENGKFCAHCRIYWDDIDNGLFTDD